MEPGLFLPITEAGSKDSTFWDDPVAVKYKSQIETMLDNSTRGNLFGFTNGNTFTSISSLINFSRIDWKYLLYLLYLLAYFIILISFLIDIVG